MSDRVTIAEAGQILGCSERRAWDLLAEGRLVRAPAFGRKTLVTRASVDALLVQPAAPEKKHARIASAPQRARPLTWDDVAPRRRPTGSGGRRDA